MFKLTQLGQCLILPAKLRINLDDSDMSLTTYRNAQVFTGESEVFTRMDFTVNDETGRLVELDDSGTTRVVDLTSKYVVPGLINAHVHVVLDPYGQFTAGVNPVVDTTVALNNLQQAFAAGVTYVRDMGSTFDVDLTLANLEKQGQQLLPGIVGSGPALTMTGGHGANLGREVDGMDEARKAARENMKRGAKNVKLMATGGVSVDGEQPTDVQLNEDELTAAVLEAHHKGVTAAAHAQGTVGIKNAVRAGVDSVEHAIYMDEEAADMMLARGTVIVPTLVAPWAINQHPDVLPGFMVKKAQEVADSHMESMKLAVQRGVKIAMGTDAGTPYNDVQTAVVQELLMMQEAGMTPAQVLLAATVLGAEWLHVADDAGELVNGKLADFVVLANNPLADLHAFVEDRQVFKKGQLVFQS